MAARWLCCMQSIDAIGKIVTCHKEGPKRVPADQADGIVSKSPLQILERPQKTRRCDTGGLPAECWCK
jgi:hypothetical protein